MGNRRLRGGMVGFVFLIERFTGMSHYVLVRKQGAVRGALLHSVCGREKQLRPSRTDLRCCSFTSGVKSLPSKLVAGNDNQVHSTPTQPPRIPSLIVGGSFVWF